MFTSQKSPTRFALNRHVAMLCAVVFFAWPTLARAQIILDGSFEFPPIPSNSDLYPVTGTPWVFGGHSGIINNSTAWQPGGVPAPDGSQVAFVQSPHPVGDVGSLSQAITLLTTGDYSLRYYLAGRHGPSGEGGNLPFNVYLDNAFVGADSSSDGMPFQARSMRFSASSGVHTLVIQGLRPVPDHNAFQDNTAFFDSITITPVPEPGSLFLVGAVLIGALGKSRRLVPSNSRAGTPNPYAGL